MWICVTRLETLTWSKQANLLTTTFQIHLTDLVYRTKQIFTEFRKFSALLPVARCNAVRAALLVPFGS